MTKHPVVGEWTRQQWWVAGIAESVAAEAPRAPFRDADGEESEMIDSILPLRALDVVSMPAAGGRVLRSLPPTALSTTDAHIAAMKVSQ